MTTIIEPHKRLVQFNLRELWNYRDLWRMYVRRNIVTVYKQTVLGYAWFFLNPLLTTIIYMVVFGGLAGISTDGMPKAVFYLTGILLWNYFSECFTLSSNLLVNNANLFSKVFFPRIIVPLAGITSSLLSFAVQLVLLIIVYIYYISTGADLCPQWQLVLLPVYLIIIAFTATSWGLIISSLTIKYRDLKILVTFALNLLMYATPIIYPLSIIEGKSYGTLLRANPLCGVFESWRFSVTGVGTMDWNGLLYSILFLAVSAFVAIALFSRAERNFVDTI